VEPDPTRARTPSDAARGTPGEDSAFPDGTLADPQVSPIPLASDPPTPGSEVEADDPLAPTLESDVPLRPDEVDTTDAVDASGAGTSGGAVLGGVGGAVAGGAIGAVVGGPIGAVAGGVVGAALGGIAGGASAADATEVPRRAPGDLEEDDAFSAGEPVHRASVGPARDHEPTLAPGSELDAPGSYSAPGARPVDPDDRPAPGSPGPMAFDADAELRALDDPDDPHLPEDREVRP
jgi:hypothetical protein